MHEKCGRPDSNGFQLKWRFGTHGNWKNKKSWGPFWSYQLNSTANSAHSAQFLRCRLLIWDRKQWDLGARIFKHNNLFIATVCYSVRQKWGHASSPIIITTVKWRNNFHLQFSTLILIWRIWMIYSNWQRLQLISSCL